MGNEPAVGLEHLIPRNGSDFDIFVFGMQESTYDAKKDKASTDTTSESYTEDGPPSPQGKVRRASLSDNNELACVKILEVQLQNCLGDDFYLVINDMASPSKVA